MEADSFCRDLSVEFGDDDDDRGRDALFIAPFPRLYRTYTILIITLRINNKNKSILYLKFYYKDSVTTFNFEIIEIIIKYINIYL